MLFSSFRWKEKAFETHLVRSVFPLYCCLLSSLSRTFRGSGFSSVHRETEHVFCFSPPVCFRRYMHTAEEPRSSFSIRGTLWVKTILLNSFQRFLCYAKRKPRSKTSCLQTYSFLQEHWPFIRFSRWDLYILRHSFIKHWKNNPYSIWTIKLHFKHPSENEYSTVNGWVLLSL